MARSIKNLIAAVIIAISGYLVWTTVLPAYTATSYLKNKIEEKINLLSSKTEIIQQVDKIKSDINSRYTELQRLGLVVPEKKGFPEIITAVENIYSRSGLVLPELAISDSKEEERVSKINMNAVGSGNYESFITFLGYFEKNIRLFDVDSIEVGMSRDDIGNDPELSFTIKGKFYWLRPIIKNASEEDNKIDGIN